MRPPSRRPFAGVLVTVLATAASACGDGGTDPGPTPPASHQVAVDFAGTGEGSVRSEPAGLDCRSDGTGDCTADFEEGTTLTLTARPDEGSDFQGWTGPGSGESERTLTVSGPIRLTAGFDDPALAEAEIPPSGGSLTSRDGRLTLRLPAGAVQGTTTLGIRQLGVGEADPVFEELLDGREGRAYRILPEGLELDEAAEVGIVTDQAPFTPDGKGAGAVHLEVLATATDGSVHLLPGLRGRGDRAANRTVVSGLLDGARELIHVADPLLTLELAAPAEDGFDLDGPVQAVQQGELVLTSTDDADFLSHLGRTAPDFTDAPPSWESSAALPVRVLEPSAAEPLDAFTAETALRARAGWTLLCEEPGDGSFAGTALTGSDAPLGVGVDVPVQCDPPLLEVATSGEGSGTVSSDPAGIECGDDCSGHFSAGITVTLVATPGQESAFAGWGGDCEGAAPVLDVIVPDAGLACDARFDVSRTLRVPQDIPTISEAIDQAEDGDEIVVAPGAYRGTFDFAGKAIVLRSSDPLDPAVVAATVLDGAGDGPVVTIGRAAAAAPDGTGHEASGTAALLGFTITGGVAPGGGGILVENAAPMIGLNRIEGNRATGPGGGVLLRGSAPGVGPLLALNTIEANEADGDGGGVALDIDIVDDVRPVLVGGSDQPVPLAEETCAGFTADIANPEGLRLEARLLKAGTPVTSWSSVCNTFSRNVAGGSGGGLAVTKGATGSVADTWRDNRATDGGGIFLRDAGGFLLLPQMLENRADGMGGGAHLEGPGAPSIALGLAQGNTATLDGGGMSISMVQPGPDITLFDGPAPQSDHCSRIYDLKFFEFDGDNIVECVAYLDGVAVDGNGGGLAVRDSKVGLIGSTFEGNEAGGDGGGIDMRRSEGILTRSRLAQNTAAADGGGLSVSDGTVTVRFLDFEQNVAGEHGGGLHLGLATGVTIEQSTFSSNRARLDGGGIHQMDSHGTVLEGSTVDGNFAGRDGGGVFHASESRPAPDGESWIDILVSQLTGNTACRGGGGAALTVSEIRIEGNEFSGNRADYARSGSEERGSCTVTVTPYGDAGDDLVLASTSSSLAAGATWVFVGGNAFGPPTEGSSEPSVALRDRALDAADWEKYVGLGGPGAILIENVVAGFATIGASWSIGNADRTRVPEEDVLPRLAEDNVFEGDAPFLFRGRSLLLPGPWEGVPEGTRIPLDMIDGGEVVDAHEPYCSYTHLHGILTVTIPGRGPVMKEDPDPVYCGHGRVLGGAWPR